MSFTQTQKEIYRLICEEGLSVSAISKRRQTTKRAVYKTIIILKKKGVLSKGFKPYEKDRGTCEPFSGSCEPFSDNNDPKIRVHGQQYRVRIINKSDKYFSSQKGCNRLVLDGATVLLHTNSLSIFVNSSFFDVSVVGALASSSVYLNKLLLRIEDKYNIILLKSGYTNINLVNCHVAEIQNGLAKDLERRDVKLKIASLEDGKVWLVVDNSFNLHEFECVHPKTAVDDMFILKPFLNDLRGNTGIMLPSKMDKNILNINDRVNSNIKHIDAVHEVIKDLAVTLKAVVDKGFKEDLSEAEDLSGVDYFG